MTPRDFNPLTNEAIASAELAGAKVRRIEPLPCEDCGRPSIHMLGDVIPLCDDCFEGDDE